MTRWNELERAEKKTGRTNCRIKDRKSVLKVEKIGGEEYVEVYISSTGK